MSRLTMTAPNNRSRAGPRMGPSQMMATPMKKAEHSSAERPAR